MSEAGLCQAAVGGEWVSGGSNREAILGPWSTVISPATNWFAQDSPISQPGGRRERLFWWRSARSDCARPACRFLLVSFDDPEHRLYDHFDSETLMELFTGIEPELCRYLRLIPRRFADRWRRRCAIWCSVSLILPFVQPPSNQVQGGATVSPTYNFLYITPLK